MTLDCEAVEQPMSAIRIKQINPRLALSRRWVFILFLSLLCRDPFADPLLKQIERQWTIVEHGVMKLSNVETGAQFLRCYNRLSGLTS